MILGWWYACEDCFENRKGGVHEDRWNTRPIEDELRKRIAELEALVERLIEAGKRLVDSLCIDPEEDKTDEVMNWNAIVAEYKEREE